MSRNRRTSLDEARRRGLSRVAPITAGIVLAGGVVSVSTAVALAATREAPGGTAAKPGGAGSTSTPAGRPVTVPQQSTRQRPDRRRAPSPGNRQPTAAPQPVPQGGGGVAPGGGTQPQGQSQGS